MKDIRHTHPLYFRWNNMLARCYCASCPSYKNYGARGIKVDERWRGFPEGFNAFVADMGEPPSPTMTIERVDNEGPYSPDNCIWADRRTQALNRRRTIWITIGDVTLCATDWARQLGVHPTGLQSRAKTLGSYEAAIESFSWWSLGKRIHLCPPVNAHRITVGDETLHLAAWLRRLGVSNGGLRKRVSVYGTFEAAIRSFVDKPLRKVKMPKRKIAA